MNADVKQLVDRAMQLLGKRGDLLSLWQTIADNFYVERATFTVSRNLGAEFADHLMTSYPLMVRRDLGNQFSGMLRPTSKDWFKMGTESAGVDLEARSWLDRASGIQKRAMYDRRTGFVNATKLGDHDYAAFGQCVIQVSIYQPPEMYRGHDPGPPHLLYQCWHLRDCAWTDDVTGKVSTFIRKWTTTLSELNQLFPGKLSPKRMQQLAKDPQCEVNCLHIVVPSNSYHGEGATSRFPLVSVYVDLEECAALEEVGQRVMPYVVPRWQRMGSQYACSPATVCALPDARLLQSMTLTLLEAGEKAVNPPMVGIQSAIRSDLQIYPGGFTAVDEAYDGKLSEVLRPLSVDKNGLPFGMEVRDDIKSALMDAFFLNKLNLPPYDGTQMTAYEVGQRVQEYIRQALPLFEPLETEYNGGLCETSFELLLHKNAFGPVDEIPEALSGEEIIFRFESPLQEAVERQKASILVEAQGLVAQAMQLDPSAAGVIKGAPALREALLGIGFSAANIRSEEEIEEIEAQNAEDAQAQQLLSMMQQGADVAATAGKAAKEFAV